MKLKRITALLLCALCCLPFAGCGSKSKADPDEVYDMYTAAEEKTNALEKYSAELTMSISADFGDETNMAVNTSTFITADIPGAAYSQKMTYEYPGYGAAPDINFYHIDGMTYYSSGSDKYKFEEADEDAITSVSAVATFALPKKAFSDSTMTEKKGVTTVSAVAKGEDVADTAVQFLGAVDQYLEVAEPIDYDISDVEIGLEVEDGYLTLISLKYSADFDNAGNKAKADVEISIDYTDVSGNAAPQPLEGIADFPYYEEFYAQQQIEQEEDDEMAGLAIEAAFALFEEDHQTKVANYDELYAEACELYGKERMDSIIELIVMFGSVK